MSLAEQLTNGKILLVRLARLGDLILLMPALRALRRRLPAAHIAVMTDQRFAPVLELCPAKIEIIALDRIGMRDSGKLAALRQMVGIAEAARRARYDLAVDLHGFRETNLLVGWTRARRRFAFRKIHQGYFPWCFNLPYVMEDKSLHVSAMFLRVLVALEPQPQPGDHLLQLRPQDARAADEFLAAQNLSVARPLIGFHPGAYAPWRLWPAEKFAALGDRLAQEFDAEVVIFRGPQDGDTAETLAGKMRARRPAIFQRDLPALAAMMSRCRLVVSNDTGPMHLAAAVGVPTLGLFCTRVGDPAMYGPLGEHSRHIIGHLPDVEVDQVYAEAAAMLRVASELKRSGAP